MVSPLATVGQSIKVIPSAELQYWSEEGEPMSFIEDLTPFVFRVEGELMDEGAFFGLYGAIVSGPDRYLGLIANVMVRCDPCDWHTAIACHANFKVGPSIAKKASSYVADDGGVKFYFHPLGTRVEGFPRISRFAEILVIE